jgi:hypothetical protein
MALGGKFVAPRLPLETGLDATRAPRTPPRRHAHQNGAWDPHDPSKPPWMAWGERSLAENESARCDGCRRTLRRQAQQFGQGSALCLDRAEARTVDQSEGPSGLPVHARAGMLAGISLCSAT